MHAVALTASRQEIKSPEKEVDVHIFNFSIAKIFHQFPLCIIFFWFWYRGYFTDGPKTAPKSIFVYKKVLVLAKCNLF